MKKKILLSSILTIALCFSLLTGATFALFTSEDKVNIAVTSGTVEAVATIENLETWSLEDDKAAAGRTDGTFTQGGTAAISGKELTLTNVIPGDKVSFDVKIENKSNVDILYSFVWATKEDGLALMSGMNVTINGFNYGPLKEYNSAWTALEAEEVVDPIKVELELPEEAGNEYQGLKTGATITVKFVQGNAGYTDAESVSKIEAASTPVVAGEATNIALSDGTTATIPADVVLEDGATNATLIVTTEDADTGNFVFANGAEQKGLNISIPEVAETNDKPIVLTLAGELASGLNSATVFMFHKGVEMTRVDAAADVDADGEFFYDATNGNIVFATTNFSNFTIVTLKQTEVASEAEFVAAVTKGENVILTEDITISKQVAFRKDVHIDLNGYAISAECTNSTLFLVASDQKPNVVITSSKEGAELNVFGNGLVLNYGSLEFSNVEINVTDIRSSSYQTFKTYGDIKLGKDVVVNVEYLGTSLISANGACEVVIDGATINVGNFVVNWSPFISKANATVLNINKADINISSLGNASYPVYSYFTSDNLLVTIKECNFDAKYNDTKYVAVNKDGKYRWAKTVSTGEELQAAIKAGEDIIFANDIKVEATKGGYNLAGLVQSGGVIDGNGNTITATGANTTWDCVIYTQGGTIKNAVVAGGFRGIFTAGLKEDLIIDNVVFKDVVYTISVDDGNKQYNLIVKNSVLNGWTSYADEFKSVSFDNCTFGEGSGYAFMRPYGAATFTNCTFEEGYTLDPLANVVLENCYYGDTLITAENVAELLVTDATRVTVK